MQKILSAEQIESTAIRELFDYWRGKCGDNSLPRRRDIDPVEIPHLMPRIMIASIEHDPFRVRYRLVGTKIVEMTGYEFTGKYLDEIVLPNDEGPILECYQTASASKASVMTRIKWRLAPDLVAEYDVCFLPLSDDGETVNMMLCMECYENIERDYKFVPDSKGMPSVKKRRS